MIRIFLDDDFAEKKEINSIYNKLACDIFKELEKNDIKLDFVYKDEKRILDNVEEIKKFLVAKDFYNYKSTDENEAFISDFLNLNAHTKLKSITDNKNKSTVINDFINKYSKNCYFERLKKDDDGNIILKKDKKDKKDKIIKELFPDYIYKSKIFKYENLSSENRHKILTEMNVKVCPYCNMNYTINYEKDGELKTSADLDHFYLKSEYPEYSLCLYNFIPSCPVCNSKLKGKKSMTRELNTFPHEDSFEEKAKFKITNIIEAKLNKEEVKTDLKIYDDFGGKIKKSADVFKIKNLYENHNDIAADILKKATIYNESYLKELNTNYLKKVNEDCGKGSEYACNLKSLIFGNNLSEKEIANTSLGKFKMDLLKQLKIYE